MITFDETQQAITKATAQKVHWLFTVYGASTHYWSTRDITFGGQAYTFKILKDGFIGPKESRNKAETGGIAPTTMTFKIDNYNDVYEPSDFQGRRVLVKLAMEDYASHSSVIRQWLMYISRCTFESSSQSFLQLLEKPFSPS